MPFEPKFTISIPIASALTAIERTRGFLEASTLSKEWVSKMQARALILEAHHTTHIEGTHLSLDQSERLINVTPARNASEDRNPILKPRTSFNRLWASSKERSLAYVWRHLFNGNSFAPSHKIHTYFKKKV